MVHVGHSALPGLWFPLLSVSFHCSHMFIVYICGMLGMYVSSYVLCNLPSKARVGPTV